MPFPFAFRRWLVPVPLAALFASQGANDSSLPVVSSAGQSAASVQRALMPMPASLAWAEGALRLDSAVTVGLTRFTNDRLSRGAQRTIDRLRAITALNIAPVSSRPLATPVIAIAVDGPGQTVQSPDEDESYTLTVTPASAILAAPTVVGALRGFETLLQLVESDRAGFYLPSVRIADSPRFRWRGLLMDVSRHFMPLDEVKRTLDGLAAVKLNVFHWHLSDDQGIRVESKRYPRLQSLGSDGLYYTQEQIKDVVAYARDRGIRVLPEFDMPGHSTSWLVAYPRLASTPAPPGVERHFGGSDAIFDPTREEVYTFIDRFIGEMSALFPDRFWHVGGDEVDARQWDTPRIRAFRRAHKLANAAELQAYFNRRLTRILAKYHKRLVGWDEVLHPNLPTTSVVQSWRGTSQLEKATAAGYVSILSAPYYLDHIETAEFHYLSDPLPIGTQLTPEQETLILGGEACMWAEHVTPETVDSRIWPRLVAIAERFWSPRDVIQVNDMYRRLWIMNDRLEQLGLGQVGHVDRMVRRLTTSEPVRRALVAMLEAVAPPTFGQRGRLQGPTQLTPLVRIQDAAVPDPRGRWETSMLVDRLLSDTIDAPVRVDTTITLADARDRLRALFLRWRDAGEGVRRGENLSPLINDAIPAATVLSRTAAIGLDALGYLSGATRPAAGWAEGLLAELRQYEQPQGLLRVTIVGPVERLVGAVR